MTRTRKRFWAWTLTLTAALLAVVWVVSMKVWTSVRTPQRGLTFHSGAMKYVRLIGLVRTTFSPGVKMGASDDWSAVWWFGHDEAALPSMGTKIVEWRFPLWSFVLLTGVPGVWMLVKSRKRTNPNACPACGYDRTGLPQTSTGPAPCSECGKGARE